jgi:hypothetical protein
LGWLERTEYPHFEREPAERELRERFTPTQDELAFVTAMSDKPAYRLSAMLLLKSFQQLHHFPSLQEIPETAVEHVRRALGLDARVAQGYPQLATPSRHRTAIRGFLGTGDGGEAGREAALVAMRGVRRTNLTEFVNAGVRALLAQGIELPAFSTLARLAREVRAERNRRLVQLGFSRRELSELIAADDSADPSRLRDVAARALRRVELKLGDYGRTRDRLRDLLDHDLEHADPGVLLHALCTDGPVQDPMRFARTGGRSGKRVERRA